MAKQPVTQTKAKTKTSSPKIPLWDRRWFREKKDSILLIPINIWGWVAVFAFLFLLLVIAYVNFAYPSETPLKDALNFLRSLILLCGLAGWLFDKKSYKREV